MEGGHVYSACENHRCNELLNMARPGMEEYGRICQCAHRLFPVEFRVPAPEQVSQSNNAISDMAGVQLQCDRLEGLSVVMDQHIFTLHPSTLPNAAAECRRNPLYQQICKLC